MKFECHQMLRDFINISHTFMCLECLRYPSFTSKRYCSLTLMIFDVSLLCASFSCVHTLYKPEYLYYMLHESESALAMIWERNTYQRAIRTAKKKKEKIYNWAEESFSLLFFCSPSVSIRTSERAKGAEAKRRSVKFNKIMWVANEFWGFLLQISIRDSIIVSMWWW